MHPKRRLAVVAALVSSAVAAGGCVPLAATGIAVGTLALLDRRTIGAQTEDTEIELRGRARLSETTPSSGRVGVTSYNRWVLLTGQVPDETAKADAERLIRLLPGVRQVFNELETANRVGLSTTANDAAITTRVKAAFLEQKALNVNTVKVVTENATVYLLGLVTQREGPGYATAASRVGGVRRVVTLFEYLSEEELARINAR